VRDIVAYVGMVLTAAVAVGVFGLYVGSNAAAWLDQVVFP
jgi:hypothetical protein